MIRGIYTAASALRAAIVQQGRLAHNLANAHTVGFKQILSAQQAYESQVLSEFNQEQVLRNRELGELENGLLVPEEITDFSQGMLQQTDRRLDLAIQGDGFFRVRLPDGEERVTRDGSFHQDAQGRLVSSHGYFVVGVDNQPITLPVGNLTVASSGALYVNDQPAGQLGLVTFADPAALEHETGTLFRADGAQPLPPEQTNIQQGYLEESNVDESVQTVEMMRIMRMYEASQRSILVQDRALTDAISLGEV